MQVLVLGGGSSPEREVSLRSAKYIVKAARDAGFDVEEYDPANGLAYFNKVPKNTIVLPILHGINGEDGVIQAVLEEHNLPYLGSDSSSSAACFDKWLTLQAFKVYGVPTAQSQFVKKEDFVKSKIAEKPYVLKVAHGGSSIGVLIARDPNKIAEEQIDEVFNMESPAVLEELIEGIEITVPVLGSTALPVIEIVPPKGEEFDYDNKYNGKSAEICPPRNVNRRVQKSAQRLAEKAHKIRNCRHLSRTDLMVRPDGSLVVFDINTIPGLTDQSLYPKSAAVAGLSMPELVKKFVELVKRDYNL
ncbi:D-alanine--D-alanine ligase [Candidatus Saccharibacteria bacterium]|nr:D-alanine--D-alanine ligase [Candidatus Saccharibacteria bacterium]